MAENETSIIHFKKGSIEYEKYRDGNLEVTASGEIDFFNLRTHEITCSIESGKDINGEKLDKPFLAKFRTSENFQPPLAPPTIHKN